MINDVRYPPYNAQKLRMIGALLFKKPAAFSIPFKKYNDHVMCDHVTDWSRDNRISVLVLLTLVVLRINSTVPEFWGLLYTFFGL